MILIEGNRFIVLMQQFRGEKRFWVNIYTFLISLFLSFARRNLHRLAFYHEWQADSEFLLFALLVKRIAHFVNKVAIADREKNRKSSICDIVGIARIKTALNVVLFFLLLFYYCCCVFLFHKNFTDNVIAIDFDGVFRGNRSRINKKKRLPLRRWYD